MLPSLILREVILLLLLQITRIQALPVQISSIPNTTLSFIPTLSPTKSAAHLKSELEAVYIAGNRSQWLDYMRQSHNAPRESNLKEILRSAAGVYIPRYRRKKWQVFAHHKTSRNSSTLSNHSNTYYHSNYNISNTVWVTVVRASESSDHAKRYRSLLRNHLCYLTQLQIQPLVYLLEPNASTYEAEARELSQIYGENSFKIVQFPYELFWKVVAMKNKVIREGWNAATYTGVIPSFQNFGALTMLIPVWEVLQHGYNVIYLDVDVALLADPVPFLTSGDADFTVSQEIRSCKFAQYILRRRPGYWSWSTLEANTGVMHLRSNPRTLSFFQRWLQEIVDMNMMNDQKVLTMEFGKNPKGTPSCNDYHNRLLGHKHRESQTLSSSQQTNDREKQFRYCFLNEFIFQNGKMEFFCQLGLEDVGVNSSLATYSLGMRKFAIRDSNSSSLRSSNIMERRASDRHFHHSNNSTSVTSASGSSNQYFYHPVSLHVNYCTDKILALRERGLWLLEDHNTSVGGQRCRRLNLQRSNYAAIDWSSAVHVARSQYLDELSHLKNGTLVKFALWMDHFFFFVNGKIRRFRSIESVQNHGYTAPEINATKLTETLFLLLPRGSDMNDRP